MRRASYGPGMPALVGLLLVVFAIAGLLVHEAWSTGNARRDIAERGLQDYVAYASWSAARAGDNALAASLSTLFRGLTGQRVEGGDELPPMSTLLSGAKYVRQCDCAMELPADYYFRHDLRSRRTDLESYTQPAQEPRKATGWAVAKVGSFAGAPVTSSVAPAAEKPWLANALAQASDNPHAGFALQFVNQGDSVRVIGFAPVRDASGAVVGALGFVGSATRFADVVFSQLWRSPRILPRAITRGLANDSLLAATVSTPSGRDIFRSRGWSQDLRSDTASLASYAGGLRLRVSLRPNATRHLEAGLVPVSRMPVWIGLLLLTGVLTAFIVRNLQREHELARLRLEFSASVSHELRTPLAQILLFGETLTLGRTRSEVDRLDAASVIVREAKRLMHLVDNTLVFSRGERPVVSLSPREVTLAPLIEDIVAGFVPLASARHVAIVSDLDRDAKAFVDPQAFRQMLLNLLDNAVKYGPPGQRVDVRLASARGRDAEDPTIRVSVDDQGPGVRGRAREEIWVPFARGGNGQTPAGTGCGLGLAVVRELAERHNGRAWVEDPPVGHGSRFVIEFPL